MGKEFEIRREVEVKATPEQVWEAVATPEGLAAWLFPAPADPDSIKVSERPNRLLVRDEGPDGFFNQLEYEIEGRGGGTTTIRYVHSGVITENWDDQYDVVNQHTDFYLHTLAQYLEHFSGRSATYIGGGPEGLNGPEASTAPDALTTLRGALGLDNGAGEGARARLAPDGLEPVDGVVDYARGPFIGVRSGEALYRFFGRNAWGGPVGMSIHHFGSVDEGEQTQVWQGWLNGVFA
jgi:hypothetical protein